MGISVSLLDSAFEAGKLAIERLWPDPVRRAEELRKLEKLRQDKDLAQLQAYVQIVSLQIEVNKEQAKSKSFFVAGARPAAIWIGVLSMGYAGVIYPILVYLWGIAQALGWISLDIPAPPYIESQVLWTTTTGLLGVASMRSFDKSKGVATNNIGKK